MRSIMKIFLICGIVSAANGHKCYVCDSIVDGLQCQSMLNPDDLIRTCPKLKGKTYCEVTFYIRHPPRDKRAEIALKLFPGKRGALLKRQCTTLKKKDQPPVQNEFFEVYEGFATKNLCVKDLCNNDSVTCGTKKCELGWNETNMSDSGAGADKPHISSHSSLLFSILKMLAICFTIAKLSR